MHLKLCIFLHCCFLFFNQINACDDASFNIQGYTHQDWKFVRDLFRENFELNRDTGASLAVYHRGKLVVDLVGGWFDSDRTKPYDNNTLQLVFSTTKGVVAAAVALCVQRGLLDYNERVTKYWPEYGQNGKENTTVAQILSHRAGLPEDGASFQTRYNWTAMIDLLEKKAPSWEPGTRQGYHALTYGWLAGELVRRVDVKRRSFGQFVREELSSRIGSEIHVGLPSTLEYRVSPSLLDDVINIFDGSTLTEIGTYNMQDAHQAEIPGGNGITNARSLAKLYASLIGDVDGQNGSRLLTEDIVNKAVKTYNGQGQSFDVVLNLTFPMTMGFILYDEFYPFLGKNVFGHSGAGGSEAFAAPSKELSFAFVMNRIKVEQLTAAERTYPLLQAIGRKLNKEDSSSESSEEENKLKKAFF